MGLRKTIVVVLGSGIALALGLAITHCSSLWLILAGYWALGLTAILVERGRYRPVLTASHFEPTPERYIDPVSEQTIAVYVDTGTGERDYRPQPSDP